MELLIGFGTDNGKDLNNDHFGMAKYYHVYVFSDEKQEFIEQRKNVQFKADKSIKHGDPDKAKATSSVLKGVDVLVGRKFGPNLKRLVRKFVCVVVRTNTISDAIKIIGDNMDRIVEENSKGEDRKHIVLKP